MPIPKLEFCCCGCTLRQGVMIIGILGLICSLPPALKSLDAAPEIPSDIGRQDPSSQDAVAAFNSIIEGYYTFFRVINWCSLILSALLIYGAYAENRPAVLAIAIIDAIEYGLIMIVIVIMSFAAKTHWIILIGLVVMALPLYLTWVIFSYAEELRIQNENKHYVGRA